LVENVKKEILRTGFPLEIAIINICSKKNTGRIPNIRYTYKQKLKEIDLIAQFETNVSPPNKSETQQYTRTVLVIECKKSQAKPWVFFSLDMYENMPFAGFMKYVSDFNLYFRKVGRKSLLGQVIKFIKANHYNHKLPKCITYFEAFKPHQANSEIYDAVDSVLSFLTYAMENESADSHTAGDNTVFFFPVVVLDGTLFEAKVHGDEVELIERKHILLRASYSQEIFIVDFVTKEYFESFFNTIEADHTELVWCINKISLPAKHRRAMRIRHQSDLREARKRREEGIDYIR